jgi:hypothetical protein
MRTSIIVHYWGQQASQQVSGALVRKADYTSMWLLTSAVTGTTFKLFNDLQTRAPRGLPKHAEVAQDSIRCGWDCG